MQMHHKAAIKKAFEEIYCKGLFAFKTTKPHCHRVYLILYLKQNLATKIRTLLTLVPHRVKLRLDVKLACVTHPARIHPEL